MPLRELHASLAKLLVERGHGGVDIARSDLLAGLGLQIHHGEPNGDRIELVAPHRLGEPTDVRFERIQSLVLLVVIAKSPISLLL